MRALSHSPAVILRQLLVDLGHGTTPTGSVEDSWPVHATVEPTSPDDCITVYATVGRDQGATLVDPFLVENEGFQVRVRSAAHGAGFTKADAVAKGLDTLAVPKNVYVSGTAYILWAVQRGGILDIGPDTPGSKRRLFTFNGTLSMRRV